MPMIEEWRPIPGFSKYRVSSLGRVFSIAKQRCLKPHLNHRGYLNVCLRQDVPTNDRGMMYCKVHRLVALAFIPNPDGKPEINHKDCSRTNNVYWNLEWTTKRENIDHALSEGRYDPAIICPWRKITPEDEAVIRADTETSSAELALRYGVSKGHIWKVRSGRTRHAQSRYKSYQGERS